MHCGRVMLREAILPVAKRDDGSANDRQENVMSTVDGNDNSGPDNSDASESPADRATVARLAKLRNFPVDTSRLEQAIQLQIPRPPRPSLKLKWFRPARAIAAGLAITATLMLVLLTSSSRPALASAAQMAQMHDEMISGKTPVMQVGSIDAANQALNAQWPASPGVPSLPSDHVMACCMKSVKNKMVACVLLKSEGEPVTLTVANASDMKLPRSPTAVRDGVTYHVQSFGAVNMVMTERNGRWVCLIGRLPANQLMNLATQLRF